MGLLELIEQAWQRRSGEISTWVSQGTNCFRVFHGSSEGCPGLALDQYGELALLQLFRPLILGFDWSELEDWCRQRLGSQQLVVWQRRPGGRGAQLLYPERVPTQDFWPQEMGQSFHLLAHHRGQDPHLFLDLRSARRYLRHHCQEARVLNLFSYTCGAGVAAEAGGAAEVLNVDFSGSALAMGRENAQANQCQRQSYCCEEVYPVIWQLAGRKLPARAHRRPQTQRLAARRFDVVVLDPPARSKGFFGAVDVERDYAGLFKPCLELLAPGGRILACNNLAGVTQEQFEGELQRCATKAGRPIERLRRLFPDADFPPGGESNDPPLKVMLCEFA